MSNSLRPTRRSLTPLAAAVLLVLSVPAGATDYVWNTGNLSSPGGLNGLPGLTINDTLAISCAAGCGTKVVDQSFASSGSVAATDTLYFIYPSYVWSNGWTYDLQGDVGLVNLYAGGTFVNEASGVLVKSAGSGTSTITISVQGRGGSIVDAMSGTLAFSAGDSSFDSGALLLANPGATIAFNGGTVAFAAGARLLGGGSFIIGTNASFGGEVNAASLNFTNGTYIGGDGSPGNAATFTSNAGWTGNGALQGSWVIAAGQTLAVQGGGARYLRGSLLNQGTLSLEGGHLYFEYPSYVLDNRSTIELQGDVGLVNTYAGGTLLNTGTLRKSSGGGTAPIAGINVNSNGLIDAAAGTLQFSGGSLAFTDGSRFTGAGTVLVSSNALFSGRIDSQNLVLAGASYQGGDGGAQPVATLHGQTRWTGGVLSGDWELAADHTMQSDGGGSKYIRGTIVNRGSFNSSDNLYFEYASYVLDNRGTLDLQGDVGLVNIYSGGTLLSSGTLLKSSGAGTSTLSGMTSSFGSTAMLQVQTGTVVFSGGSTSFASGAKIQLADGTAVSFSGGQTTFADGVALLGNGQFTLGGNATVQGAIGATHLTLDNVNATGGDGSAGSHATLTSDARWTGSGTLLGSWTVGAGQTLSALGGGARYIRGAITNQGTLVTDNHLYFEYPSYSLDNPGRLELRGDVGLVNVYAGGTLTNSGTLVKSEGTGTSPISGMNVSNSGLIDVKSGTLQFSGGTLLFNDGTRFTGAGTTLVTGNARFAGAIATQNLVLAGAGYEGGDGGANPAATLHGSSTWSGGVLGGQWVLAADHTLSVTPGGSHYIRGTVVNQGTVLATDNLYFEYPSYVLDNRGTLNLQADVGLINTYVGGTLINSGLIVKSGGTGESSLATMSVLNSGTIAVQTGTLRLPADFTNQGRLMGNGHFATNLLVNQGHIAPGASPGTLTLDGSLVLDGTGTLDIELQDLAQHDLLAVGGNVTLGGTLALQCFAACSFTADSDILILDGSGTLSGAFDSVTFAGFGSGDFSVVVDVANADVWLHVNSDVTAAVPEPASWAVMLGGLAALAGLRRRRRG
jgi:hypothetical protein